MQRQRRLAAILVADVAGYSRLMEADEAGTLVALKERQNLILEPTVCEYGGRIVKVMGDGVLAEFASVVNAVAGAIDLQRKMAEANAPLPDARRIVLRIGINLGDVIGEGADIYGEGVNIAARLETLAESGGICISAKVYEEVRGKLSSSFEDMGEQTVKNLARAIRAYRLRPEMLIDVAFPEGAAQTPPEKPSIAVLPFQNLSGDPEQEYFVDGMVEDIITELSRFHSLFVIARNSSFVYKGRSANIKEVGRTLGVRYVAEGSVRRLGNRVRVTAQLIDARTGSHLWAERFDRELEDIFAVQDEVARRIVTSIAPLVEAESLQLAKRKPPQDMQAYDYYLKARPLVDGPRSVADVREARDYCNRAIQIDPSYARAYACKALSYIAGFLLMETDDGEEWRKQALQWAEQAVALDAMDGVNQWALGEATFYLRQYDRSCRHMARAVSLNPNDADVLAVSGFIQTACGHSELGLLHMEMARERNPSNPPWYNWIMGGTLYLVGRYDDALAAFELFGRRNAATLRWRAATLVQLDRIEEARADMHALLAIKPSLSVDVVRKFFDYLPNIDSYVDSLRQAGLPE